MTREELKQYRALKREIRMLQERISKQERVTDTVTGSSPYFPYTAHHVTIEGTAQDMVATRRERRLKRQMQRAEELAEGIEQFIESITDSEMRQIMRYRYLEGLSWQRVAYKLGETDESYPRRKHNIFMENAELAENAEYSAVK